MLGNMMAMARVLLIAGVVAACRGAVISGLRHHGGEAVLPLRGVSESGLEFGSAIPGTYNKDYTAPANSSIDFFSQHDFTLIRVPFLWERLQPSLGQDFDGAYFGHVAGAVAEATSKGLHVLLDVHNYARYRGQVVGAKGSTVTTANFADLWSRLATVFKRNKLALFGLMNEPHDMPTELVVSNANAAIAAIRATGASNLITVCGNGYSGAHSWNQSWYGTPNSVAMLNITDPGNNFVFEMHQYLDSDSSGTHADCVSADVGVQAMSGATSWLQSHGYKALLGEFAGGNNPTCKQAVTNLLEHLTQHSGQYAGWVWWSAGPWWGNYMFSLEPPQKPQQAWLAPFL